MQRGESRTSTSESGFEPRVWAAHLYLWSQTCFLSVLGANLQTRVLDLDVASHSVSSSGEPEPKLSGWGISGKGHRVEGKGQSHASGSQDFHLTLEG